MHMSKLCLAACALLGSTSLHAEIVPIPANLSPTLRYGVSGKITAACTLTQDMREVAVVGLADTQTDTVRPTSTDLGFAVDCNSPMLVRMQSQQGGLRFSGIGTTDSAFISLVPYNADLELPGLGKVLGCRSSAMSDVDRCSAESNGVVMAGRGRVAIRTEAYNGLLLAGQYTDQLTVSLTPILGGESVR